MQPVPTAPTAAEDGGLSTHVLHMTRLHAKRPSLVELRVINGPFEGGCRLAFRVVLAPGWRATHLAQVWGGAARWSPHRRASAGRAHTRLSLFVNLINLAELVKHTHTHTHTRTHTHKSSLSGPLDCVGRVSTVSCHVCVETGQTRHSQSHSLYPLCLCLVDGPPTVDRRGDG